MRISKMFCMMMLLLTGFIYSSIVSAQDTSAAPNAGDIFITNNAGKADTIVITRLSGGDVVKVYTAATGGKLLGTVTLSAYKTEATLNISQLGSTAGSIYVTVKSVWELESNRTKVNYAAEPVSDPPDAANITITNNAGKADVVDIIGLYGGETIKVYNAVTAGKLLATMNVSNTKAEASINITQLGMTAGSAYITITCKGELESTRTKVDYLAEPKSEAPNGDNIIINNNVGKADTVVISGLYGGETVKVYNAATAGKLLGFTTASASKTEATVTIPQIGSAAGSIYMTVTNKGELESGRTKADYPAEPKSEAIDAENVTITNNAGLPDTIYVSYLSSGDIIKVFDSAKGGSQLGTATVAASKVDATVTISQLGKADGSAYISITSKGMVESDRIKVNYVGELKSTEPDAANITVTNNGGASDTILVSNLKANDVVRVYDAAKGGTLLGMATVSASSTEAQVTVSQIGNTSGSLYVAVTNKGSFESNRVEVGFSAEAKSAAPDTGNIIISNNSGKPDTVYMNNLGAGDIVKIYEASTGTKVLGTATVAAAKTEATITISQLGTSSGNVYISVTSTNKLESQRTKVYYASESVTDVTDSYNINVINNPAGKSDIIQAANLTAGDIVKVYDSESGGSLLGSATVSSTATEATITVTQLGKSAGKVYVSVTSLNKLESSRMEVSYAAESKSDATNTDNIVVTNNKSGTPDTVEVTGLLEADVVKVYDSATGGKLLGTATVPVYESYVKVSIAQLGTSSGSVYVTITGTSKLESDRIKADYSAESKSDSVNTENIIISNNAAGTSDTVEVAGLNGGDIVKVYDAAKGGSLLGTATVADNGSYTTVTIAQLGTSAGNVYVTVTSKNKIESDRVKGDYSSESRSDNVSADNIVITNNAGSSDTIQLSGLSAGDGVKVYDADRGGNLLGSTTVSSGSNATISITQLGKTAGSVYITTTAKNKAESSRLKVDYAAEQKSQEINANNVTITNNVGTSDIIKVTGISENDTINVYDSEKVGNLIGTATAGTYQTSVSITVTQLGTSSGSVYITVTGKNKLESDRVKADYTEESKTKNVAESNITVVNNAGMSDTVKVSGLTGGDTVNVYDASKAGELLGTAVVSTYDTSVLITVTQLGSEAGSVYVSVAGKSKLESDRTKADYGTEPKSDILSADNITIVNNAGISDTIKVSGVKGGDVISIYDAQTGGNQLGTVTVSTYDTYGTVVVTQLGGTEGSVYATLTQKGKKESDRVKANYSAEPKSDVSDISNIIVTNNAGASDTVQINGLSGGDVVNVYDSASGGNILGTATVSTYESYAKLTITQLGTSAGKIYVSVISKGKLEGNRAVVSYAAEQKSDPPVSSNITITNNAGIADTVTVTFLEAGDLVKVYNAASDGTLLGSGTVASDSTEITIKITQLGSSAGNAYLSVVSTNKLESTRTSAYYAEEATSVAPESSNVQIINNVKIADMLTFTFLKPDDIVKVYNAATGGSLLGSATVPSDTTQVTVSISQLGDSAGNVYISVTSLGKKESARTKVSYSEEQKSTALSVNNITIKNNAGMADIIGVSFLNTGDIIKVYDAQTGGSLLTSGTVSSDSSELILKVNQLGASAGYVYVSVTNYGKLESDRTKAYYIAEMTSDAPELSNITITNNSGKSDTVYVGGLGEYDVVKVYDSSTGGNLLGTAMVDEDDEAVTIKISQLGTSSGNVYISVTSDGAIESSRTKVGYSAEN